MSSLNQNELTKIYNQLIKDIESHYKLDAHTMSFAVCRVDEFYKMILKEMKNERKSG